jgi:3-oxoacyl-[acyl-carrier protein] reductase
MELAGKSAVVTGSATGICAATARALAARGCNVVINYTKSEAEANETAAACRTEGAQALVVQGDVAQDADCRRLTDAAVQEWGRLDILVNNAGITRFARFEDLDALSAEDFMALYAVNVIGAYQASRAAAPHMRAAGEGAIVNVSSVAGLMAVGSSIAYAASKGALNSLTLCLAKALAPEIRVNAVCPSFVATRWFVEGRGQDVFERIKAHQETTTPLRVAGTPEMVAKSILYLIADADLTTGEFVILDAGSHLGMAPAKAR